MSATNHLTPPKHVTPRILGLFLAGGALGFAVGFALMRAAKVLHVPAKSIGWQDFLGIWLGIVFVGMAIAVVAVSFSRKRLARTLEGQDAQLDASNEEVTSFRLQAAALGLAGILLLIPIMTEGIRTSNPAIALPLYLAILVLFAIQTAINVKLYRSSDEFLRNTMLVTCSVTFAICQGMLFLWAAAERMTLVPSLSSWSAMNILMTVYISVSFFTSLRQFR